MRTQGARSPSESKGNDSYFVQGQTVAFEETRHIELKEIKTTTRAVDSVKNTVDEYVVAFLNVGQLGSIFWGIRDSDRVVIGARFNTSERDSVRREVANKVSQIQPHIDASLIKQHFHQVFDEDRGEIPDLFVLEIEIPAASAQELYATQGGEVYMKTDGGRLKLNHLQVIAEIQKRKCGQLDAEMFSVVADLTRRFQTNSGNAWCPPVGSSDHKLAEIMAIKGMLVRTSPGAYALPNVLASDEVA